MRALSTLGFLAVFAVAATSGPAQAITCKKGIPCGNACISADKTCHIGPGDAKAAPKPDGSERAVVTCPKGKKLVPNSNPPSCK
jgi:hypothetical protein